MKIGIITYHRSDNYGSVLQAYALVRVIRQMGYNPEIIDYHSSAQDNLYKIFETSKKPLGVIRNIHSAIYIHQITKRKEGFANFRKQYLPISSSEFNENSDLAILNDEYDCFICGSDQIWNTRCADFTKAYLLDFVRDKNRCLSYAASIGRRNIEKQDESMFHDLLLDYHCLSTREDLAAKELKEIIHRELQVVPDPVLLLDISEWEAFASKRLIKKDYILCYYIGNVPKMRQFARMLHKMTGLPLVFLNINLRDLITPGKRRYDTSPSEFVSMIKHAKYICTNSFHAVLFSAMFKKDFWVFTNVERGSERNRIDEIANRLKLENRIVNEDTGFPKEPLIPVNYSGSEQILCNFAKYGIDYLANALGDIK